MGEASVVSASTNNLSKGGSSANDPWWLDDEESPIPFDASEGGLWSGNFLPPPPRPVFLDEAATPDGLTTCDLCSWAWKNGGSSGGSFSVDTVIGAPGELGWVVTLVIVSLISAFLGAVIMIIVLHCRRIKNSGSSDSEEGPPSLRLTFRTCVRPPINPPSDKEISIITPPTFPNPPVSNSHNSTNGVWSWLSRRPCTEPSQLEPPLSSRRENHYTHMEEPYNSVTEGIYAEVDRDSATDRDSNSPAYQNSAYTDPDAPSAPSSAYYSDLSITPVPERAYEIVGLVTMPTWDASSSNNNNNCGETSTTRRPTARLAVISENSTVPSDYV